jgi:hypothetical protein
MTVCASRLGPRLLAALALLDDGKHPYAETWRELGVVAAALGLAQPSYEAVRLAIRELRRRPSGPTTGDILLDIAFRSRPPMQLLDRLAGTR